MTRDVCDICHEARDLRYGACFACADYVKTDGWTAWDVRNPKNRWMVNREPQRTMDVYISRSKGGDGE